MASHLGLLYLILQVCVVIVRSDECTTYNFEIDVESLFTSDKGTDVCVGIDASWSVGNYTDVGVASPHPNSFSFINVASALSCGSSFEFTMTAGGAIEVNVYVDHETSSGEITVYAMVIDWVIGTASINFEQENFTPGWQTLRIPNIGAFGTFQGYISVVGSAPEGNLVLVDSFRYIPPDTDQDICVIYKDSIEPSQQTTMQATEDFTSTLQVADGYTFSTTENTPPVTDGYTYSTTENTPPVTDGYTYSSTENTPPVTDGYTYYTTENTSQVTDGYTYSSTENTPPASDGYTYYTTENTSQVTDGYTYSSTENTPQVTDGYTYSTTENTSQVTDGYTYSTTESTSQETNKCVTYTFEKGFYDLFNDRDLICSSVKQFWEERRYADLGLEPPHMSSTTYISPIQNFSCVSSFEFELSAQGVIEFTVYMSGDSSNDQILVTASQIFGTVISNVGVTSIHPSSPDFVRGWSTHRMTLINHIGTFRGYITFLGMASSLSTVLVDSFRYIPPPVENDNGCTLYEESLTTTTTITETTTTKLTTSAPTIVTETTTAIPSTTGEITETTISLPTTVAETTTAAPTPATEATTTVLPTTVSETTVSETSTSAPTIITETTTAIPSTTGEITETTISLPTTVAETTTAAPTAATEATTTVLPTTVSETTVSETSTAAPTIVTETTTGAQTTSAETTVLETTTAVPTTVVETTASEATITTIAVAEITVSETTTAVPTTVVETTASEATITTIAVAETTVTETTTAALTTVIETTASEATTATVTIAETSVTETTNAPPTTVFETTASEASTATIIITETSVTETTTAAPTIVTETTTGAQTTSAEITVSETTIAASTTVVETTALEESTATVTVSETTVTEMDTTMEPTTITEKTVTETTLHVTDEIFSTSDSTSQITDEYSHTDTTTQTIGDIAYSSTPIEGTETTTHSTNDMENCITYNFESDYDVLFSTDNYLCEGLLPWQLDNYTSIEIESPNPRSTVFISPHEVPSCISSFIFEMEPNGVIEANVFMDPVQALDHIIIIAQRAMDSEQDTVAGSIMYHPENPVFLTGWNVIRFSLTKLASFNGYLLFIGSADRSSTVVVDSFRYIPPLTSSDDRSCIVY